MRWPGKMGVDEAYPHLVHIFQPRAGLSLCYSQTATLDDDLNAWIIWGIRRWKSKAASEDSTLCPYCLELAGKPWTRRPRT